MTAVGTLTLAGTPIGNPQDASAALIRLLSQADLIAAEDTRRLRRLMTAIGIDRDVPVISCHEHNEAGRIDQIVQALRGGQNVALVSDAGMPCVSDPGYRLVQAVVAANLPLSVVPGPSAVTAAIALSGLPSDRFCFEGFLPRKTGDRERALRLLEHEERTMVFFEAPHRLVATLGSMQQVLGSDRPAAVCRELSKTYEEVVRGSLTDIAETFATREVLGEITIVVGGADRPAPTLEHALEQVRDLEATGIRTKDAVRQVAAQTRLPSRELYQRAIQSKTSKDT